MASVKQAKAARAAWTDQVEARATPRSRPIRSDGDVREAGRSLFGDNCAACHGMNGTGRPGLPRPHAVVVVGQFARGDCRDHPGRHQLDPQGEPGRADAGVRARSRAEAATTSRMSWPMCSACPARRAQAGGQCRGRQGRLRRELRGLPRAGRQGQDRGRRARPDRQLLDYGGDEASLYTACVGRPAGPDAELGRPAVAGRAQDPRPLSRRLRRTRP